MRTSFLLLASALTAFSQSCDRDCLRGFVTSYLDALIAHDPKSLPVSPDVRFTEDGAILPLGEGLWKTAGSLGTFRQDILDVRQGVAGTHVVVMENGSPVLLAVRLKVQGGRISEIETMAVRNQKEGMIFRPDAVKTASSSMTLTPPAGQRDTREEISRIAQLYPAGLKTGSFIKVDAPFAPDAYRFENGQLMAGPGCTFLAGCSDIKGQRLPTLAGITWRVAAIDEEQGIAWLRMNFGPGSTRTQGETLQVFEMFKIYGGQIHAVEAFMETAPASAPTGWEDRP